MQEWVGEGGVQQWAFSAGGRWQSNCVHARVVTKNSRKSNWAYMKILYWRVGALGRTNVLRKVSFFLHKRCCQVHRDAWQKTDTVSWLVAVGCERGEGDKVRNTFLILHHVLSSWSILTFGAPFVTEAVTKRPCRKRSTDQLTPARLCPLHHHQCLCEGVFVAVSVTL